MKKLVTFRFDADVLADARQWAEQENRSLTNFIETVLKQDLVRRGADGAVGTPGERL